MIAAPEKPFEFAATNSDRHNEARDESMHGNLPTTWIWSQLTIVACVRKEVQERLYKLGVDPYYFPGMSATKPAGPHIPILAPPPGVLHVRKRVFIVVNDSSQDLGILSYSRLQRDLGVNGGSIVSLAKELVRLNSDNDRDDDSDFAPELRKVPSEIREKKKDLIPGLIVMNTGQLLYSHKLNKAMTLRSWLVQRRRSIIHNPPQIHEQENRVEGHRTPAEHIKTVFDEVICNGERVDDNAEIYLIAIGDGLEHVLKVLEGDCKLAFKDCVVELGLTVLVDKYGTRIAAMAVIQSSVDNSQIKLPSLRALLYQRTRQWKYTDGTSNPMHCIELPENYRSGALSPDDKKRPENKPPKTTKKNRWNERRPSIGALSDVTKAIRRFALRIVPAKKDSPTPDWDGPVAICPTFAGGTNPGCDHVFTDPSVQHAVLSFFGQVISDPDEFYNTDFRIHTQAPQPTAHSPLAFDPNVPEAPSAITEVTPEQVRLDVAREYLDNVRAALDACPADIPELAEGRARLTEKIANKESEITRLEEEVRASEESKATETEDKHEKWQPQAEGLEMPFAGHMLDSELVKAAGLGGTAGAELEKPDIKGKGKAKADDENE
jgi:hypothetical protein